MIPYPYNMVDMGGIDFAEIHGQTVGGLYSRIAEAATDCGEVVLYNWKFAEIEISPQHVNLLITDEAIMINGLVQVTAQDEILVPGIIPPLPPQPPVPVLVQLLATQNGIYIPSDYEADGFDEVNVNLPSFAPWPSQEVFNYVVRYRPMYNGGYEYTAYVYNTQFATDCGLVLLADASQGATNVSLSDSIDNYSGVVLQGVYSKNRTSQYNTTILYLDPELNISYWAGMKDRNSSYTCNVVFNTNESAVLSGNKQVIIYGIP